MIDAINIVCNLFEILTNIAPMILHIPKHCTLAKKTNYIK